MKQSATLARLSKKTVAFLAAATTLLAGLSLATAAPQQANAATRDSYADTIGNPTFEAARQKYGLPKDMKDGATLHAFEWSFKTIMENIPDIAKAGYTSIQTEPIVKIKDNRKLGTGNWYLNWYYVYQPTDMSIGNYVVGSEDEFKEMCKLAHQYGLRIIVDSVSNHFTSDFDVIEGKWKNKAYYHEDKQISDYNNREDCTQHKLSGLWDLNTQDDTVTEGMHDLLVQTVADGADGFRYDAAKHIELSDEVFGGKQSHYWDTILQNGAQYQYGEVLEDANVREADYANLFNSSSPRGGGITDSSYGHEVRNAVQFKNLGTSHFTSHSKVTEDKSVNWVESHDNFANGEANIPQELSDEWIKYGWAGVTAQKNGMSLFFDRPYKDGGAYGTGGVGTYGNGSGPFTENSKLGDAGSDLWKDPEVVAVNHFRNAMVGEASNVSNCGDDNCLMVERYVGSAAQDGMMVANANASDKNLAGTSTKLANGTYTDEVTGSTITVSGGKVTSGTVKKAYQQGKDQLDNIADLVGQVSNATHMLPSFLGQNGARTYLLAAQTTSETRSGGGLVGSLGTMTADHGKIAVGDFHPNGEFVNGNNGTAEEHAVFNRPLGFSFDVRDTFAVPDVSRNAEMLNASWQRSQYACNIDGLISVDPVFIQKMVEINGPVTLSNGTVLTGENTAEYMLNTIYKDVPVAQQDEYFEYIAKTVMDGAFGNMTVDKMMKVAQSIGDLAENRHFYAYTFHDDEAKYFQGAGLAKNAPESETNPETGIYISEQNPSKMGWYIDRTSEVTKTGDKTYHVKYTLTNRMTSTEMATCTSYILGGEQKGVGGVPVAPSGTSAQRVLIYAPAGGSIGSIAVTGDVRDRSNATMDGKPLNSSMAYIAPGKSVTYEFDVTVSDKATANMKLDQTPCGKMTNDVKYNY